MLQSCQLRYVPDAIAATWTNLFQSFRGDGSFTSIDRIVLRGNVFIARQGQRYTTVPFQYNGHYTIQGLSAFDGPYSNWTIENNVINVEVGLAMGLYGMSNSTSRTTRSCPIRWHRQ